MNTLAPRSILLAGIVALAAVTTTAHAKAPAGYPPLEQYTPASLAPNEPRLDIPYPGGATTRSISRGTARVAVLVDANNTATDFLVTQATDPAFGQALLDDLKHRKFQSAQIKGVAVPDRVEIAYAFDAPQTGMQVMEAAANNARRGAGLNEVSVQPESKLDGDLVITAASLPLLPSEASALAASGKPVKVFVTFFVDEQGHVRIPQVESSPSPALVADAIRVVQKWSFKPPTIKGKPALVIAGRPVRFLTEAEARKAMSKQ